MAVKMREVINHILFFIAIVELMQKGKIFSSYCLTTNLFVLLTLRSDSSLPCFAALGVQTAQQLRDRFHPRSNQQTVPELIDGLVMSSLGSNWTRLYDSVSGIHSTNYSY